MAQLSPMMTQYLSMKEKYKDCILFFRLGDFYEMFFEDALLVSKELELTLTGKNCGLEERAPMCGVPFHSAATYIQRLVDNGHKVAICEQVSDPATSKGIVDRDVIRVITKGTIVDSVMLDESKNSFIASVFLGGKTAGISYCDVSTGEYYAYSVNPFEKSLRDELIRIQPSEIVFSDERVAEHISTDTSQTLVNSSDFSLSAAKDTLLKHFKLQTLDDLHIDSEQAIKAASALLRYIYDTQKIELTHITQLKQYYKNENMFLDTITRDNLELSKSLRHNTKRGSLLAILDKTCTAMGARQLKSWVDQPLARKESIEARLGIVEVFADNFIVCDMLRESLNNVYDLERILSKISYKSVNPRDCLAILRSLREVPGILKIIRNAGFPQLEILCDGLDPMDALCELIEVSIDPDAPIAISDGGYIKQGFNADLDALREASTNGKEWLLNLEEKERTETGIKNLRIAYNKVFGYYIEVTKSNLGAVPLRYIRKQTLTGSERYTTEELQSIEGKLLNATQNANKLEMALFEQIRIAIETVIPRIQKVANALKSIDAYCALASVALDNQYVKPTINTDGIFEIKNGRHPIVESMLKSTEFIANDTYMDGSDHRTLIITGPNMSGKSTYMRQNALIAIMAHIGSFVPASAANICVLDRVFTRIGASDSLSEGQSTFMVEMSQTANILKNATRNSLVILDEIGRGTSTFDGLSIAWAVVEYITKKIFAKTLFATHYHELSDLEGNLEGVKNYCISVKEYGNEIIFLHKIIRGGADKSYGIHVAQLAGVPLEVIKLSQKNLFRLEAADINNKLISENIMGNRKKEPVQKDLFHLKQDELIDEIKKIDVMSLNPMQALTELFRISEKAKNI